MTLTSKHWNNRINLFLDPKTFYNDVSFCLLPKLYNVSYLAAILAAILNFIKLTMGQKLFLAYLYSQLIVESIKTIKLPKTFTSNSTEPSSYNNTSYPHIYTIFNSNFLPNPSSWDFHFLEFYCLGCAVYGGTNRFFYTFF